MKFKIKFTEDFTKYNMNWEFMIPDLINKRGAINVVLDEIADKLTYQKESFHEFDAENAQQALEMANKKKLDWVGAKTISKIEIVSDSDTQNVEVTEVVEITESSKIISIFSLSNTYNFAQILEKMIAENATHAKTHLTSMHNFIYDLDLVEKRATNTPTNKQPLKVLNDADADEMRYIAAHTDAKELELREFGNKTTINLDDFR